MAVAIAVDDARMARARIDGAYARIGDAHVRDDASAMSLRLDRVTVPLNITQARARRGGGVVGARRGACVRG